MFRNRGLPLKAETVEYAWLYEITCGTLTGQITAPQLSSILQSISNLVFSAADLENAILSRHSSELCQHALIPVCLTVSICVHYLLPILFHILI